MRLSKHSIINELNIKCTTLSLVYYSE